MGILCNYPDRAFGVLGDDMSEQLVGVIIGMMLAPLVPFIFAPEILGHHVGRFLRGVDKGRRP